MRTNEAFAAVAEKIFPGSSYHEFLESPAVCQYMSAAGRELASRTQNLAALLTEAARQEMLDSLAELLAWMMLFGMPEGSLQSVTASWIEAQEEFLVRLGADLPLIERHFGVACHQVVSMTADISDRHNGGRTVAALTFDSGFQLVYKPRCIEIEDWYFSFLRWLNDCGSSLSFRSLGTLRRCGYGWIEFAAHVRCVDTSELREYYRNAGALLCVLTILRATDCHFQNLIACRSHPVLVDAETLFQPSLVGDTQDISVLRTGMIPHYKSGSQFCDMSALGCVDEQLLPVPVSGGDGTQFASITIRPEENVPFPLGQDGAAHEFVSEMSEGFRQTYDFLVQHRQTLFDQLQTAVNLPVRYVFRGTFSYYAAVIAAARSDEKFSLSLLPRAKAVFQPLAEDELRDLENFDIPRFTLPASGRDLGRATNCFQKSGFSLVRLGVERLGDEDKARQLAAIRLSWSLYRASKSFS